MGLKFVLGLIVLVVLIEMILTAFDVPIFGQDYNPTKLAENVEEEVTRIAMDQGIDIAVIAPIKEKIDEFRLNSDKAMKEDADIKPRYGTCPPGWLGPNLNCECWRYVENEYGQGVRSKQYGQRNYVSSIVYT